MVYSQTGLRYALGTLLCERRKWQPTQVFLSGKFHGQSSLGKSPQGSKEWTELTACTCGHSHTHTHKYTHSLLYGSLILTKNKQIHTHTHIYNIHILHTYMYNIFNNIKSIFYRFFDIKMNIIQSVVKI